jgi:hypothetical protein
MQRQISFNANQAETKGMSLLDRPGGHAPGSKTAQGGRHFPGDLSARRLGMFLLELGRGSGFECEAASEMWIQVIQRLPGLRAT